MQLLLEPVARPPSHGLRVLVADDNVDAAESLATLLRIQGHEVVTSYTGSAALKLAESFAPEAAFLDIGMPGMSGYELAIRLRNGSPEGRLRLLVAVTGYSRPTDRRLAAEAGFDHHLLKPVDPKVLLGLLNGQPARLDTTP